MKNFLLIISPLLLSFLAGVYASQERNTDTYPYESVLEDFVLDVVDETDFWEVCDSTRFNMYTENTTEWYFAVCMEYARQNNY